MVHDLRVLVSGISSAHEASPPPRLAHLIEIGYICIYNLLGWVGESPGMGWWAFRRLGCGAPVDARKYVRGYSY